MHEFHPTSPAEVPEGTACYAIAGRGYAGVVNYVTLVRSERGMRRIGDLPVVFVGIEDPWFRYREIKMGQWPYLLSLPGFRYRPGFREPDRFVSSAAFARATRLECQSIRCYRVSGEIRSVTRSGDGLELEVEGHRPIKAAKLDVCTGLGPSRRLHPKTITSEELLREYLDPASRNRPWRRIVTGEEFLQSATLIPQRGRICVIGDGATAAWCAEAGLKTGNEVLWVAREKLGEKAFPASLRNDCLLHASLRGARPLPPDLLPASEKLTWAEGYVVERVDARCDSSVGVTLVPALSGAAGSSRVPPKRLGRVVVDQVVAAIGHLRSYDEPGSNAWLLRDFVPADVKAANNVIFGPAPDRRPIGLTDEGDLIRVLGAAALTHPAWQILEERDQAFLPHVEYRNSLCDQAKMPASAALAATAIAEANGYFELHDTRNINAIPVTQLQRLAGQEAAAELARSRSVRRDPFLEPPAGFDSFTVEY